MNTINKKITILFFSLLVILTPLFFVNASYNFDENSGLKETGEKTGHTKIGIDTPESMISTVIEISLSFLGVFFLILIIYAGYIRMTARGNKEDVNKSNIVLRGAIIGLIIVISAYMISTFVLKALTDKTLKQHNSNILICRI